MATSPKWKELNPGGSTTSGESRISLSRPKTGNPSLRFNAAACADALPLTFGQPYVIALDENATANCPALAIRPGENGRKFQKVANCGVGFITYAGLRLITEKYSRVRYKARAAKRGDEPWILFLDPVESER